MSCSTADRVRLRPAPKSPVLITFIKHVDLMEVTKMIFKLECNFPIHVLAKVFIRLASGETGLVSHSYYARPPVPCLVKK